MKLIPVGAYKCLRIFFIVVYFIIIYVACVMVFLFLGTRVWLNLIVFNFWASIILDEELYLIPSQLTMFRFV